MSIDPSGKGLAESAGEVGVPGPQDQVEFTVGVGDGHGAMGSPISACITVLIREGRRDAIARKAASDLLNRRMFEMDLNSLQMSAFRH